MATAAYQGTDAVGVILPTGLHRIHLTMETPFQCSTKVIGADYLKMTFLLPFGNVRTPENPRIPAAAADRDLI